jgi:hypothetical protein
VYGWLACIVLLVPLVYLYFKYKEKQQLDCEERNRLQNEVELLKMQKGNLNDNIINLQKEADLAIERYNNS